MVIITALIAVRIVYDYFNYKPQPFFEVPFRERIQSKVKDAVKVSVAVLSAEESKQVFGVNLAIHDIQPVWIRVENSSAKPYHLMSSGLDPNYYSPLEAAYTNHSLFLRSRNKIIDEHFQILGFRNPIAPGTSVSGFIHANRDEGTKLVEISLISKNETKFFTFFVPVPGTRADYHSVDFDRLYSENEIVDYDEDELRTALKNLPCCATNEDGTREGDPLNMVFIGSRDELAAAFVQRGWLHAEETYAKAVWKTIKSYLFGSRYRYSPVSPLYLYGRRQDYAGQKPRHTILQRNHIRVWLSPMRYQGKPVWIGQISRDIGVRFTSKAWPPVTHKIDPDIDEALYALLEDLAHTQKVMKFGWVEGVGAATRSKPRHNLTGDPFFTHGLRAVLMFDQRPRSFESIQYFDWEPSPHSTRLKRLVTRQQQVFDEQ